MKVTAFVGSARKKHTYHATERFLQNLKALGDVEGEIVVLSDHRLEICRGCKLCTDRGEELCPLKDDRDMLLEKFFNSDGIVFASPNYSFAVSGQMKVFLDRLGFALHRPRCFGKTCTSIVVQGVYGGKKIVKYLDFVGRGLGFNVVKGSCLNSLEPMTEKISKANDEAIDRQSRKFYAMLIKKEYLVPSLLELIVFRWGRTSMQLMLDESYRDYAHYKKSGWFASAYYYPTRLNLFKKLAGKLVETMVARKIKNNKPANDGAGNA